MSIGADDDIDAIFDKAKEALQRRDSLQAQRLFERVIAKGSRVRGRAFEPCHGSGGAEKVP